MITGVVGLIVGAFIGWLIPEPQWAKNIVAKIKAKETKI